MILWVNKILLCLYHKFSLSNHLLMHLWAYEPQQYPEWQDSPKGPGHNQQLSN